MRTGEIVDLANERRLSAVLDFTPLGGELLILNGGSRAEELVLVTVVSSQPRSEQRAAYCIDSGTSMQLFVPLSRTQTPDDITLRIVGGHGEMLLAPPKRRARRPVPTLRGWSTLAAAIVLALLAGGKIDAPVGTASADPEPAPVDAPLIRSNVSLHVPGQLPSVVAAAAAVHQPTIGVRRPLRLSDRRTAVALVAPPKRVDVPAPQPAAPAPMMTDLRVPATATAGEYVPVAFGAVARQVKIVASIGPTVVSKTIVGAGHGVIKIRSPKSDLDSRVMTVRAYAENGNRTSTLQAMVVLVHP